MEFIVRGPVRFAVDGFGWNDFIPLLVQSRAWVHGANPYSADELVREWPQDAVQFGFLTKDLADGTLVAKRGLFSSYPPMTFVLLALLTPFSWHINHAFWFLLVVGSFVVVGQVLASFAGFNWRQPRTYVFWALMLAAAPFHTAIATGNLVLPAFGAAMVAFWAANTNRHTTAGIFLAIAVSLKPPLGIVFLTYYVARRRWRIVLVATTLVTALGIAGVLWLWIRGTPWVDSFISNSRVLFGRGAINDFTSANPLNFQLVNLQMPLYLLTGSVTAANAIAWSAAGVLFLIWMILISRQNRGNPLLALSALAFIALLPVYHRFVDAVLLALPLCWAFTAREPSLRRIRNLILAFAAPFLFPGAAMLVILAERGVLPASITTGWWWNTVLIPHQVWAVLCISVMLLFAMAVEERSALSARLQG